MKINVEKYYEKIKEYYYSNEEYSIWNDSELTFQECCLIYSVKFLMSHYSLWDPNESDLFLDTDEIEICDDIWFNYYIAQFYQPMIIDKPWDEVLVKRCDKNNVIHDDYGNEISFWDIAPFNEIKNERNIQKIEYRLKCKEQDRKREEYRKKRKALKALNKGVKE